MLTSVERIVLVGFMASGKSTIGPLVARHLGWDFCDMDPTIEARLGCSIAQVFAERGEAFFREQEELLAAELAERPRTVISAGGGAFVFEATRRHLVKHATTVWLRCAADTILARLALDHSRPLATTREKILQLMQEREPVYRQADLVVDTGALSAAAAGEEILTQLLAASRPKPDGHP